MRQTTVREGTIRTLRWLTDLEEGGFIETRLSKKDYLGFHSISQQTLDTVCTAVNVIMMMEHNKTRVYSYMGEIRKGRL